MSAVEEYKRVCAIVRGKEYWAVERGEVADVADAALAELEAKLANAESIMSAQLKQIQQAEAELAELKARCCETCENVLPWFVISQEPDLPYGNCMEAIGNFNGDDGQPAPNPPDFFCGCWVERSTP